MEPNQAQKLIQELTAKLNQANKAYYQVGESSIDDIEYDIMLEQLKSLEDQYPQYQNPDSPTVRVGGDATASFQNVAHNYPMLSLSNLYTVEDLNDWIRTIENRIDQNQMSFSCEVKIDGLAISIIYENGLFVQAVTRGNGEVGDDVTNNVRTIQSLPLKLDDPASLQLRGEIFLPVKQFQAMNEKKKTDGELLFKNPRNAAAGAIRMKDPRSVAKRGLDILLYDIVDGHISQNHSENLDYVRNLQIPVNPYRAICHSAEDILSFCRKWESEKQSLPFEIDGVVIKVENLGLRETLGVTQKSPRWSTAWKFKAERGSSHLISIENSIGRTGILTPVANLEPIQLQGTVVRRATLHNYEQIARLGIHHEDTLFVEKGGEIIPKIIGVDYSKRGDQSHPVQAPDSCPECETLLVRFDQEVDLRCENPNCPAVIEGRLEHYVSKKAMDIQFLGSAMIKLFIKEQLISEIPDIYRLKEKPDVLMEIEGFGDKSVENLLQAIELSKRVPLNQFIYALGIRHIGEKAAKTLALKSESIEGFLSLNESSLEHQDDFGPIMMASLLNWTQNSTNRSIVESLIALGVAPTQLKQEQGARFQGLTVVITGTLSKPRQEWKQLLEMLGFKVTSAVTKKTNYLLTGENPGSKLGKAQDLGVEILSEEQAQRFISS